ncbi:MAG: FHA domain-containing protein [Planctomycetota bacterium]
MPKLLVEEEGRSREVLLGEEPVTVGRDLGNGVVIQDRRSSRRHCRVSAEGDNYVLEDLRSSNGTLLNGRRATRHRLADGDRIEVGEVRIIFVASGLPAEARAGVIAADEDDEPTPIGDGGQEPRADAEPHREEGGDPQVETTPTLRIASGDRKGEEVPIDTTPFHIGRKATNELALPDARISSLHARILREGSGWFIEDCDSGNGLFVNRKRVRRHKLFDGDQVTLGGTTLELEGLPPPPQVTPAQSPSAVLRVVDEGDISEEDLSRLRVDRALERTSPLQGVWTALFMVSFLVILYCGYRTVSEFVAGRAVLIDPDNLVQSNPSFEENEAGGGVPGWRVDGAGDSASLSAVSGNEVPHGRRALRVESTGGEQKGIVRVLSEGSHELGASPGMRISAQIRNLGFDRAGVEVLWLVRRGAEFEVIGESFSPLLTRASFTRMKALLYPPPWGDAELCKVAIVGLGHGTLEADDISLKPVEEEPREGVRLLLPSRDADTGELTLLFAEDGSTTLLRGREVVLRNMRVALDRKQRIPYGQILPLKFELPRVDETGSVRNSLQIAGGVRGETVVQHAQRLDDSLKITWQWSGDGPPEGATRALVLELDPHASSRPVTLFHGSRRVLRGGGLESLDGETGDEWVLGERSRQVIFRFSAPVRATLLPPARSRGVPTILLGMPERLPGGILECFLSSVSNREQRRIEASLGEIARAHEEGRGGAALGLLDDLEAEFPWRDDVKEMAVRRREEIRLVAQRSLTELKEIRLELAQLPGSPILGHFRRRAQDLAEAFEGTRTAEEARRLLGEVMAGIEEEKAQEISNEARRILRVGEKHFAQRRDQLARFYFEWVIRDFPGSPEEAEARHKLQLIDVRN